MGALAPNDTFLFEGFHFDRRGLFRRDERGNLTPVSVGGRALDLLGVLLERHGEILSKAEIMAAVWPKTVVEEGNLTLQISALRRILDRITSARLGADPLDQSVETFAYLIHFGIVGKCSLQFGELRGRGQPLLCQGLRHPGPPLVVDPIAH